MKMVYVAHPIGGDVQGNIRRVLAICHQLLTVEQVIPVVPYVVACQYLNDDVPAERQLGMSANDEYFRRRVMDEVWLYGDRISNGMAHEIALARQHGITVIAKTPETELQLNGRPN